MPEIPALIATLILERPMCVPCIATRATTSETGVETALARIASVLVVREFGGRCRACGQTGIVVSAIHSRDPMPFTTRKSRNASAA